MENLYLSHPELYDKEYLNIIEKNNKLKLELFHLKNDTFNFQMLLVLINIKTVQCNCKSCKSLVILINSLDISIDSLNNENTICTFKNILDKICEEYNIKYGLDDNVHIKLIKDNMWNKIEFGNLLLQAKSLQDQEIINYQNFYKELLKYVAKLLSN
jgi:hypothetical protein